MLECGRPPTVPQRTSWTSAAHSESKSPKRAIDGMHWLPRPIDVAVNGCGRRRKTRDLRAWHDRPPTHLVRAATTAGSTSRGEETRVGRLLAIIRGFISAQQRDSRVARPRSGMGRLGVADNGTVTLARSFNATPSPVGSMSRALMEPETSSTHHAGLVWRCCQHDAGAIDQQR